jgi:hypothetical protein
MPLEIHPFDASRCEAVRAFNRRLAAGGSTWRFPESPEPSWLARAPSSPVWQEFFVAEDAGVVRGAYAFQHRPVALGGAELPIATWYLPVSEGVVDPKHALVAAQLLRDAIRRAPLSYGLGMDGADSPVAKLVEALRGECRLVPFFVRIENGARFAREARYLRRRRALALALDVAALSGLASLGAKLVKLALARSPAEGASAETVLGFGAWADDVWRRCRGRYSFVPLRDAATLARIYPPESKRFERLRVSRDGQAIGWAVLQRAEMRPSRIFGALHVGRITDCFAAPEDAGAVMRAAVDALAARGVDLMLSNQLHPAWCEALRRSAFLPAPSNFVFGPTAPLAERIRALDPGLANVHLNRGDSDGPWGEIRHDAWGDTDAAA